VDGRIKSGHDGLELYWKSKINFTIVQQFSPDSSARCGEVAENALGPSEGCRPSRDRGKGQMSRVAYVDGQYIPHCSAAVGVEDRGYQVVDGVGSDGEPVGRGSSGRLARTLRAGYLAHATAA
jgi:hypothetical protein